jgi:Kelch motif
MWGTPGKKTTTSPRGGGRSFVLLPRRVGWWPISSFTSPHTSTHHQNNNKMSITANGTPLSNHHHHNHHNHHGTTSSTTTSRSTSSSSHTPFKFLPDLNTHRHDASVCVVDLSHDSSSTTTTTNNNNNNTSGTRSSQQQQAIVVVGGFSSRLPTLRQVELLEWNVLRRWWQLPPLVTARCGCALVTHNQRQLFCVGGLGGGGGSGGGAAGDDGTDSSTGSLTPLATMETYTIGGDAGGTAGGGWDILPTTMSTPRMYPAAVAYTTTTTTGGSSSSPQQCILVVGGKDLSFQELDTCEVYTLQTGQWEPFPSMTRRRFACGLVYLPSTHSIVAIGGFDAVEWTTSMEQYDFQTETWTELPPMIRPIQFVTATVLTGGSHTPGDDYIVVRGQAVVPDPDPLVGRTTTTTTTTASASASAILQCYSVLTREWIVMPPTSTLIGAAMTSVDHSRIVTVGGGTAEAASGTCRFWMPNLPKLFGSGGGHGHKEKYSIDGILATLTLEQSQSAALSLCDESTVVHPWLHHPSGSASVAASVARSISSPAPPASPGGSGSHGKVRRKVDHMALVDRLGIPVQFTGFLHAETGKPHGKGMMMWPLTGDKYEGRFEQGGTGNDIFFVGSVFGGVVDNPTLC